MKFQYPTGSRTTSTPYVRICSKWLSSTVASSQFSMRSFAESSATSTTSHSDTRSVPETTPSKKLYGDGIHSTRRVRCGVE